MNIPKFLNQSFFTVYSCRDCKQTSLFDEEPSGYRQRTFLLDSEPLSPVEAQKCPESEMPTSGECLPKGNWLGHIKFD